MLARTIPGTMLTSIVYRLPSSIFGIVHRLRSGQFGGQSAAEAQRSDGRSWSWSPDVTAPTDWDRDLTLD